MFSFSSYETVKEVMAVVNDWVAEKGMRVLNIETVVLPNIGEGNTNKGRQELTTDRVQWSQVIRVWYEVGE